MELKFDTNHSDCSYDVIIPHTKKQIEKHQNAISECEEQLKCLYHHRNFHHHPLDDIIFRALEESLLLRLNTNSYALKFQKLALLFDTNISSNNRNQRILKGVLDKMNELCVEIMDYIAQKRDENEYLELCNAFKLIYEDMKEGYEMAFGPL